MIREGKFMMLAIALLFTASCSKVHIKPAKPQSGEKIVIVTEMEFKDPLMELVFLKENVDFDYHAIRGKKDNNLWVFQFQPDTLTSYVLWRIVDGDSIYFENGKGIIIYYGEKPMRLAYYYAGLHKERAIPYPFPISEKEKSKIIRGAIKCYKRELKYYPGEPMAFGRLKVVEYFRIKGDRKKAQYLYRLEKELDSLFNTRNLYAALSSFNVAYFFEFPKTYDYFKFLSENPYIPGVLDASMSYLYQYARNLGPKEGVKWLEIGLEKYKDFLQGEQSTKIKNTLRNYYYSLYYGFLTLGDTMKALNYLWKLRDLNPFDPEPFMVEASLRMSMGPLNYRVIDSLLYISGNLFHPVAYCFNFPFYPVEQRMKSIQRKELNYLRIKARYYENTGRIDSTISTLRKIIEIQGGDFKADYGDHEDLGLLLLNKGDVNGAIEAFANAVITGSEWGNLKGVLKEDFKKRGFSEDSINTIFSKIEEKFSSVKVRAPEFTVESIDGKKLKLSDYKGKIVVLNFWATWCGPCRREIPDLNTLVEKYKDDGDVIFLAITNDSRERVLNFLTNNQFDYKIAFDPDDTYEKYNVTAVPTHVIIDRSGYVAYRIVGSLPQMDKILEEKIESVRGKK